MLFEKDLLESAIKNFPKWMDIRKRYFSSNGGKLLTSQIKEIAAIQNEIDKYIEEHFIPYYEDKCDKIVDYVYKVNIGTVDLDNNVLTLVEPAFKIVEDIETFYGIGDYAYYQDGFIFVKNYIEKITYRINSNTYKASTEKMNVWNVYDEFAVFIGIERYEDETNQELFNRIIATSQKVLNSSESGLKNAIITSLTNIVPDLSELDITIEKPTASNLIKYYDEFNTILDKLEGINRDVIKDKRWDLDKWEHDFVQIDYIPHTWDMIIDEYVNGIGDNDDLKPIFLNAANSTDVEISFYKKSEDTVNSYIKNENLSDTLSLALKKYDSTLNAFKAEYSIIASDALEVVDYVKYNLYEAINGKKTRYVEDLIEELHNIDTITPGILTKDKYYKVKFSQADEYSPIIINECYLKHDNASTTNLLKSNSNFILNNGALIDTFTKKNVTKTTQLNSCINTVDTDNGMEIKDISTVGELVLNIDGCNGQNLKVAYDCKMSDVLESQFVLNNFYYDENQKSYISDVSSEEKTITININANKFSTTITQGTCNIVVYMGDSKVYDVLSSNLNNGIFSTGKYDSPQEMKIVITSLGLKQSYISNLSYSNYEFTVYTETSSLLNLSSQDNLYILPVVEKNNLHILMRTYTQYSPTISKIFIGEPLKDVWYETDLISGEDNLELIIDSDCNVELYESSVPFDTCNKDDTNQSVISNYSTKKSYIGNSSDSYIVLDVSEYSTINSIETLTGNYEILETGSGQKNIIRLQNSQQINTIVIDGYYNLLISSLTIHELIKNEFPEYDQSVELIKNEFSEYEKVTGDKYKLYANKYLESFVVIRLSDGYQKKIEVTLDSFKLTDNNVVSKAEVVNMPSNLQNAFLTLDNCLIVGTEHTGAFEKIFLYPKSSKEYVANNECLTYSQEKDEINIVNTFNNGYVDNSLVVYVINSTNKDFDICFANKNNWSLGKQTLILKLINMNNYNIINKSIIQSISLDKYIELEDSYTLDNKETIELAEYMIKPNDDYEVVYGFDVQNTEFDRAEYITINSNKFNKLKYSNIYSIKYLGDPITSDGTLNKISSDKYTIDLEKGIITWVDLINVSDVLYVQYSIKKPIAVKYNIDYLYKKVQYTIQAYQILDTFEIQNINTGSQINLNNPSLNDVALSNSISNSYSNSDVIYASCSEASFKAEKFNNFLLINRIYDVNKLAIKTGWYYMFGKEYYMFATDKYKEVIKNEYVTTNELIKDDGKLVFHKKTNNHVVNSKMILGSLANVYKINNFSNLKKLSGSSYANSITACDSYNYWSTFAMNISLNTGLNGLGLYFETYKESDIGYALLDITDYLNAKTHISFYNPSGLSVFIGKESSINGIVLNSSISISTLAEITDKYNENIYYTTLEKEDGFKYYLVVRGTGILDDIILQDGDNPNFDLHTKNIDALNLNLTETVGKSVITKLLIDNEKGVKDNGTEIDGDGYIVNSSSIDWDITKIKEYKTKKEWENNWDLQNASIIQVDDTNSFITANKSDAPGKITSKPIYIGDPKTVKSVIYKINDLPFTALNGFTPTVYQSKYYNGPFTACYQDYNSNSSIGIISNLLNSYIQLSINIPKSKVINNIEFFVEYKSNEEYSPIETVYSNGFFISNVLDSHYSTYYKVKSIDIESQEGLIDLYIRGAKEGSELSVWTDWHKISVNDTEITNDLYFNEYRFFQLKVQLNETSSKIKINSINLEVVN
jgi:hypothetical protein